MPWIEFTGLVVFHLTKCRCKSISAFIRQRVKAFWHVIGNSPRSVRGPASVCPPASVSTAVQCRTIPSALHTRVR